MISIRILRPLIVLLGMVTTTSLLAADGPRLLLAGGALPVCSNNSTAACVPGKVPGAASLANRHRLDTAGIARVADGGWLQNRESQRRDILATLRRWHQRGGDLDFASRDLPDLLAASGKARDREAWTALAGFERDRVLDALERKVLVETVALGDSSAESGAAIYREFVTMARQASGRQRPRLLVSTASGRDPFAAIRFYLSVFTEAGADVRWLPLDHALRAAQSDPPALCAELDRLRGDHLAAHDRGRLYPERAAELKAACLEPQKLLDALNWADGVFLNGGDQSFTRAAWFDGDGRQPSAELSLLLQRLERGALVLGGTSAGTAVQSARPTTGPAAMIVSGPAIPTAAAVALRQLPPDPDCARAQACGDVDPDALMYQPEGGLGSFTLGVLDTHFSNRGREYRLARLLLDSGVELGIGIDETTALRLDREDGHWHGKVIGQGAATLLRRVDPQRVLRQRYPSGSQWVLPGPTVTDHCELPAAAPASIEADSDGLQRFLDGLSSPQAVPLTLVDRARRLPVGQLCAAGDGRSQLWEFPR